MKTKKSTTGNFGQLAEDYEKGRKPYPSRALEFVLAEMGDKQGTLVADVGCGTGISTRAIASANRLVIGIDPDQDCLKLANQIGGLNLAYRQASAEQVPFADNAFDHVATFCSFHWWYRIPGALDSICRVLRPGGCFIILNKNDAGSFREEVAGVVESFSGGKVTRPKQGYRPAELLRADKGHWEVRTESWQDTDCFTQEELIIQIRSMAPWSAVPEACKEEAERRMAEQFRPQFKDGLFHRPINTEVVIGRKI